MSNYSLKTILSTFTKSNGKHRIMYNKAPVGGLSGTFYILMLWTLPLISYLSIFTTPLFDMLGIATSIILFIISSSIIMIMVFVVVINVKKSVIKLITPSWEKYFGDIDLKMMLSNTVTPYSDFFKYYEKVKDKDMSEDELYKYLRASFDSMKEENEELLKLMHRDKNHK